MPDIAGDLSAPRACPPARRASRACRDRRARRPAPLFAGALLLAALVVPATPAAAEIEIVVRPDGTRVVRNVGSAAGASKSATRSAPARTQRRPAWREAPRPELEDMVAEQASTHGLDPRLVQAVIQTESAWNRRAVSRTGAMGLMQIMPSTAVDLALLNPWEESENVRAGTAYLARQVDRFGNLELALAAYNAGPGAVARYGGIPPFAETRDYVRRVLSLYRDRDVTEAELAPHFGRGTVAAGTAPGFVRDADGRLTLTNQKRDDRPTVGDQRRRPAAGVAFAADRRTTRLSRGSGARSPGSQR